MTRRRVLMSLGLVAAAVGDWFMAGSDGLTGGIVAFSVAQALWIAANFRDGRFSRMTAFAAAVPLAAIFVWRTSPVIADGRLVLMAVYAGISVVSLAVAQGTRRLWYAVGIDCLFASDVAIALRMSHVPHWAAAVGPLYLMALLCLVVSTAADAAERRRPSGGSLTQAQTACFGFVALALFVGGMLTAPGPYNPLMMMLSRLGRIRLAGVDYPFCHYLFTGGLLVVAATLGRVLPGWGGATAVAGLLTIAAVPEDVSTIGHNLGCHLATLGGAMAVGIRARSRADRLVRIVLYAAVGAFALAILLHACAVIPFAPAVPTLQKAVIVLFAAWVVLFGKLRSDDRTARGFLL